LEFSVPDILQKKPGFLYEVREKNRVFFLCFVVFFLIFKDYISGNVFCLKSRCEPALPCCGALNWPRESASTLLCRLIESYEPTSASLALVARTRSVSLLFSSSALDPVRFRRGARTGRLKTSTTAGSLEMAARNMKARLGGARIGRSSLLGLSLSFLALFLSFFISLNLSLSLSIYIEKYMCIHSANVYKDHSLIP
jgi:hypothetical protein